MRVPRSFVILALLAAIGPTRAEDYVSAEAAYRFALAHFENRQPAKGHAALEAALKLMPDEALKGRIYRTYLSPQAQPAGIDKVLDAADHILRHARSDAEKSLNRSFVTGYFQIVGKSRDAAEFFEKKLKQTPEDEVSLYVLSELYERAVPNPKRMIEVSEKLVALGKKATRQDTRSAAALAAQYVRSKRYTEGATLFEKIAPQDPETNAWHLKEAAVAWLKAGDKAKARAAALAATSTKPPERRSRQLTHFWHRHLGETLAETGDYGLAADHMEKAIASTDIEGYRRDCQARLVELKAKLKP